MASNVATVESYLLEEVDKVYKGQGIGISDKHIEVIARQMLRKMLIIESGDTDLLPGSRIDTVDFTKANTEALMAGKRPAVGRPIVLGITKAALDTKSFLSSASFQETTRVLTDATVKGRIDYLHGLKENVMIGKLIPAGTGFYGDTTDEEDMAEFQGDENPNALTPDLMAGKIDEKAIHHPSANDVAEATEEEPAIEETAAPVAAEATVPSVSEKAEDVTDFIAEDSDKKD
jgi:hypothetical protein